MDAKIFARDMHDIVVKLLADGATHLRTESVISYLDQSIKYLEELPSEPSSADLELYKAKLQTWVEEHRSAHAHKVEMFRSVIESGQNALRTAFLLNGGGAIAMLTFVGNLAINDPLRVPSLAPSLTLFVVGVLLVTMAAGATYMSQWLYSGAQRWSRRAGFTFHIFAIVLPISSYGVFGWGVYEAYTVFAQYV